MAGTGTPLQSSLCCFEPSPPETPSTSRRSSDSSGYSSSQRSCGVRQSRPRHRVARKPLASLGRMARNAENTPRGYGAYYGGTRGPVLSTIYTSNNVCTRPQRALKRPWLESRLRAPQKNFVEATIDSTIHLNDKTLKNLMDSEAANPSARIEMVRYHNALDETIGTALRANAVLWLNDVCREQQKHCDCTTLPLAVSYMDRFLSAHKIDRTQLQTVASACLLIAIKMKAPELMPLDQLVGYSDGGTDEESVMQWEMLIANALKWDFCTSTALEFFDQLLVRAPSLEQLRARFEQTVWSIQKNILLAILPPSVQALVCLYYVSQQEPPYAEVRHTAKMAIRKFLCIGDRVHSYRQQLSDFMRFIVPSMDQTSGDAVDRFFEFIERLQVFVANEEDKEASAHAATSAEDTSSVASSTSSDFSTSSYDLSSSSSTA